MANLRNGNSFYVDATGILPSNPNIRVCGIAVTPSASPGSIALQDQTTLAPKGTWSVATSGETTYFHFYDQPLLFPNGIKVSALTNATALLFVQESKGG